ncbi:Copper chaperone CopZ [Spirosomataceae bacterium TFI 002]|nr:Copper chaperone CopZ [Spirosomataceae bacterium TFI 002]
MKKLISMICLGFLMSVGAQAQNLAKNEAVVNIKTSAICKMCKNRIEKDLSLTKGVKKADLNLDNKVLTLTYNSKQTDPSKLRKAVSSIGYDADEVVGDEKAHDRLPDCCQKTAAPHVD